MTKTIKYIFIFLSASYFLIAGTGYNVVKYCCESCKKNDNILVEHKPIKENCCKRENPLETENGTCNVFTRSMKCFFMRVNVDTPLLETLNVSVNPAIKYINLNFSIYNLILNGNKIVQNEIFPPPEYKIPLTGREILTLKAVLLI